MLFLTNHIKITKNLYEKFRSKETTKKNNPDGGRDEINVKLML